MIFSNQQAQKWLLTREDARTQVKSINRTLDKRKGNVIL